MRHAAWLWLLVACASQRQGGGGSVTDATRDSGADVVFTAAGAQSPWIGLVREQQWQAAAAAIDALPDAERKKPETRFVRAMVALARNDGATAVAQLDGLEPALGPLTPEIARTRARAQVIAGPFDQAGEWLEAHAISLEDHVEAATAFMRAKLPARANAECARVLASERRSRAQEAAARRIRLHTGETGDAVADARWLLVHGELEEAKDAETILAKEDAKHPLTQRELLERAESLADANHLDEALHAIERAQGAVRAQLSATAIKRARADVMMRARTRYLDAAALFKQCSDAAEREAASDLLASARALSRADHDDEAIDRYLQVISRFPRSPEAASARFYAARLELLHGRWEKAATRFDEYLTHHPGGPDSDEAARLRAIARYQDGPARRARTLLEETAGSQHDAVSRAGLSNLAAEAALRDGDRTHAVARFTDVAQSQPLTWPALVARARLVELGAAVPPAISSTSAEPASPLSLQLPPAVATLHDLGLDGLAEDALHTREADMTSAVPARSIEALCVAYGLVDRGRRRMQVALQLSPSYLRSAPDASSRWAWECAYPSPYATAVRDAEQREGLPPGLLYAVMRQESSFDERALSPARAVGVLQLLPETADAVAHEMGLRLQGVDELRDPLRSIALGARYLHDLLGRLHGSVPLAVAAYNAGDESVLRWLGRMHAMKLDAFVESIPFLETRGYVMRVMENYARYSLLARGEAGVPKIDLALP